LWLAAALLETKNTQTGVFWCVVTRKKRGKTKMAAMDMVSDGLRDFALQCLQDKPEIQTPDELVAAVEALNPDFKRDRVFQGLMPPSQVSACASAPSGSARKAQTDDSPSFILLLSNTRPFLYIYIYIYIDTHTTCLPAAR
jgi:hypothetical protein